MKSRCALRIIFNLIVLNGILMFFSELMWEHYLPIPILFKWGTYLSIFFIVFFGLIGWRPLFVIIFWLSPGLLKYSVISIITDTPAIFHHTIFPKILYAASLFSAVLCIKLVFLSYWGLFVCYKEDNFFLDSDSIRPGFMPMENSSYLVLERLMRMIAATSMLMFITLFWCCYRASFMEFDQGLQSIWIPNSCLFFLALIIFMISLKKRYDFLIYSKGIAVVLFYYGFWGLLEGANITGKTIFSLDSNALSMVEIMLGFLLVFAWNLKTKAV